MNLPEIPTNLSEKIKSGNIVLFVGAGLSMAAGYPDWFNLTINILEGLKDKEKKAEGYINALQNRLFEPIDILGKLEPVKSFAIEAFDIEMKKYSNAEPSTLHKKLPNISTKIITTNFDNLLEKCHPSFEKVTYYNNFKLAKISDYSSYIFKIHGDINEPDKCILFPSEYNILYNHSDKTSIFELKKIFSDRSILFVGFSLTDPYLNYIIDYISTLYSGFSPEHFIVTTEKNRKWPERITPLVLEEYSLLDPFVDLLISQKENFVEDVPAPILELAYNNEGALNFSGELEYDIPPNNKFWVGRKKEVINISNNNFKVIFITGIGGQGKSALAAHFIKSHFDTSIYEFGDWRDFKEENNRFHSKLISIIKRISNGHLDLAQLEGITSKELVEVFFHKLSNRRVVFVFDNVDSYIDLETFSPTGGIGHLFNAALKKEHNARFIFTCRPFIREASVEFYQINLSGLSYVDSLELLTQYKLPFSGDDLILFCQKVHELTKGHPLWLNLIAAQATRGKDVAFKFVENIENKTSFTEDDFSAILSQKILNHVWTTLNEKQKNFLRALAESVKPELLENLREILSSEFNNNQFNKAFRVLRNLNLIEVKSSSITADQIELHPLVKEFIVSKYARIERDKYITLFVQFYDRFIYILKPKLSANLPLTAFQYWTSKIELQINKEDFKSALVSLHEVGKSISLAGFGGEYIRVAEKLFDSVDWRLAIENEYPYFHVQLSFLNTKLVNFGLFDKARNYLTKYEELITGKSVHYLSLCSDKCYFNWFQEDYANAILIGEQGEFMLDNSGLPDHYLIRHNLALARRDSREKERVELALNFFRKDEDIQALINSIEIRYDLGGIYYGNIGRCFEFLSKYKIALKCYSISLKALLKVEDEKKDINVGYACFWISEMLLKDHKILDALYFHRYAMNIWEVSAPYKLHKMEVIWNDINFENNAKEEIRRKAEWQIEKFCMQKLENELIPNGTKILLKN